MSRVFKGFAPVAFLAVPAISALPAAAQMARVPAAGVQFSRVPGFTDRSAAQMAALPGVASAVPGGARIQYVSTGPIEKGFAANVNLLVIPAPPSVTSMPPNLGRQIAEQGASQGAAQGMKNYTVLSTGTLTVAGTRAQTVSGSYQMGPANTPLKNRQALLLHGGKLYVFTFTAPSSSFARLVPGFDQLVSSIRWL